MLTDAQIKFLYKEYGLPEPDVAWVRKNLPTTENELKNILREQVKKIKQQEELKIAQERIKTGRGTPTDKANVEYAEKQGILPPNSTTPKTTTDTTTEDELTPEQKQAIEQGHSDIDAMLANGEINEAQAAILHEIFAGDYTSGQVVPSIEEIENIIQQAGINAAEELGDYYTTMTAQEIEDLQNQFADIRLESERYAEREAEDYAQKLASTKQSLRQRGMTFSGVSRKQLGAEGALEAKGIKGQVPGTRRMNWEEKEAGFSQKMRETGLAGERLLGSQAIKDEYGQITTPYGNVDLYQERGGITGSMPLGHEARTRTLKWQKVGQYRPWL